MTARWIDADAHIFESKSVFDRLDKDLRDKVQITFRTEDPFYRERIYDLSVDGNPIPAWRGEDRQKRWDVLIKRIRSKYVEGSGLIADQYLKDLDIEGLDRVVVYPTLCHFSTWMPQVGARLCGGIARAYNDWVHEFCAVDRRRLATVCAIAPHDISEAIREVKRNADRGFVGVVVRPNPLYGRTLGHPDWFPLYEVAQDLGMTIGIHEGTHTYVPTLGSDRTNTQAGFHIMCHPFEQMAAMCSLSEAGVFDRFPKLNFLFLESGALWAAYWVRRLDAERKHYRSRVSGMMPSEHFNRQCYVAVDVDDDTLPATIELLGGDRRILMSTDYPHDESQYPNSKKLWEEQPISAESKERIGILNNFEAYPRLSR
jgi:predicted TIM-barrel fold metal-dependent hydrolase